MLLLGVGGNIYNQYTITPLQNLGIRLHKVHQLATRLHYLKKLKQDHKIHFNNDNSDNGGSIGRVTGRASGFRKARRRPHCMADNPLDPH
jgi:hypothetical protein